MSDPRSVALRVPAEADYLVLARLALAALCRLTELRPEEISDLKLAVTEAAGSLVSGNAGDDQLEFRFDLGDESLGVGISGGAGEPRPDDELATAIVAATVDDYSYADGHVKLVKYLTPRE
jgi:hypothetical protein